MVKVTLYSAKGIKKGSTNLPRELIEKENLTLLAQAVRVYEDRLHPATAKVKTRGEVRASSAKIWRQKGTGRARHGDVAAPIFVGGGVAHGPRGRKRKLTLPKGMRQKALKIALSLKAKEGKFVAVDNLSTLKKTKDAQKFLDIIVQKELAGKTASKITLVLSKENENAKIFFRNIKDCEVLPYETLNARSVFFGGLLVIDKNVLAPGRPQAKVTKKTSKSKVKLNKTARKKIKSSTKGARKRKAKK